MGTIAARDAERIGTLTERVVAIHLLAAAQACDIRDNTDVRPLLADVMGKNQVGQARRSSKTGRWTRTSKISARQYDTRIFLK